MATPQQPTSAPYVPPPPDPAMVAEANRQRDETAAYDREIADDNVARTDAEAAAQDKPSSDPAIPVIGQPWPENAIPDPKAHAHHSATPALYRETAAKMEAFSDTERVRFVRMLRDQFGG
jgi:hypothetical protein